MSDSERKRRNAAKMRELINLIETRVYDTLERSSYFDIEVRAVVRDRAIQDDVEVTIKHKERLS